MTSSDADYVDFALRATRHYADSRDFARFGQVVFNVLETMRPDIADQLRGTDLDPFYKTSVDDKVWSFIRSRW